VGETGYSRNGFLETGAPPALSTGSLWNPSIPWEVLPGYSLRGGRRGHGLHGFERVFDT
jgi:hypothetical protein